MSVADDVLVNLRKKLDLWGFKQPLPLAAFSLVDNLFGDFVKTTKMLRDAKEKIVQLLEEKSCWDLGVEPYKCDNARLLAECSALHRKIMEDSEKSSQHILDMQKQIRGLHSDKRHLEEHCQQLQAQIRDLEARPSSPSKRSKGRSPTRKPNKPFVSTVRSGGLFPGLPAHPEPIYRCIKCHTVQHAHIAASPEATAKIEQLEEDLKTLTSELELHKRSVEARENEIRRLNDLFSGGRPPKALAKDCCYSEVRSLRSDNELLRRETRELQQKVQEYQDKMHEAMEQALKEKERVTEVEETALRVETSANKEIAQLYEEMQSLKGKLEGHRVQPVGGDLSGYGDSCDREAMKERLNELTRRESELCEHNERLTRKLKKLKSKVVNLEKELEIQGSKSQAVQPPSANTLHDDEHRIRLQAERDFFQKQYLRLVGKTGSDKEVEFLQSLVRSKDDELRTLRAELCMRQQFPAPPPTAASGDDPRSGRSETSHSAESACRTVSSDCVQAAILRSERERDCVLAELERVRMERDMLREKHVSERQMRHEEAEAHQKQLAEMADVNRQLELQVRDLTTARLPNETQIVLLKEDLQSCKERLSKAQEANHKLNQQHSQLKLLHEQTERSLMETQHKLSLAQNRVEASEVRYNTLDTNRDANEKEVQKLRCTVDSLRKTYVDMENEKDALLTLVDEKSEEIRKIESAHKQCQTKRNALEKQLKELETDFEKLKNESRQRGSVLTETTSETKTLRHQITALKASRDKAIAENAQLANDLADCRADISKLKKKLHDAEAEVNRLKEQLREYVKEVKKAEDLLMDKEREREEMLEHYRSLSQDACMLEGNNQSLEVERAEYKRQAMELEAEIVILKKDLCHRNSIIQDLEDKIISLTTQLTCVEHQLEEACDEQRLLKVDLAARKELCDKLDIEKGKLNAELHEVNAIRLKMERELELLRTDVERTDTDTKACSETLEELLAQTREDLQEQMRLDAELSQQLNLMQEQNDNLMRKLNEEKERREQADTMVREIRVQNDELRHNITDDRFRQARNRDQSPRFPVQSNRSE